MYIQSDQLNAFVNAKQGVADTAKNTAWPEQYQEMNLYKPLMLLSIVCTRIYCHI